MPGRAAATEHFSVLWVTPALEGLAGTGPAARASAWLPPALSALGHRVRVVMPRTRGMPHGRTLGDFAVPMAGRPHTAILRRLRWPAPGRRGRRPSVPVYLVDSYEFFGREEPTGYPDDGERFAFFCLAVVELLRLGAWAVDVVHLHDWPCGPVALLQRLAREEPGRAALPLPLRRERQDGTAGRQLPLPCVFTFYRAECQGRFPREILGSLGLPETYFHPEAVELYGQVSYLKAGLLYADGLATVSRAYVRHIQQPPHGHGLEGLFRKLAARLVGIVHGIDVEDCDPASDPRLHRRFTAENPRARLYNKVALLQDLGLTSQPDGSSAALPVAAYVGELTRARGAELLLAALPGLLQRRVRVVVLGDGEPSLEQAFLEAARSYPGQVAVVLGFNPVLIRRTYAGADMVLVPALDKAEVTGHLMAMRYGAVPVVRAQGTLADTVLDFQADSGLGNGFVFRGTAPEDFLHAVDRALDVFRQGEPWRQLVRNCMACDLSWSRTAVEYAGLYAEARTRAHQRRHAALTPTTAYEPAGAGPGLGRDGARP